MKKKKENDRAIVKVNIASLYGGDSYTFDEISKHFIEPNKDKYLDFSILVEDERDYGSCCATRVVNILGHRYENDIERAFRLDKEARDAKKAARLAKATEEAERKKLAQLIKKYGKP